MRDEEPQAAVRDLYWGWTAHFYTQNASLIRRKKKDQGYAVRQGIEIASP